MELASGGITLSVALLLKRVLSADNHLELIAAVRGASSQRASEILAARFPRPDVPSRIRKLPDRQNAASRSAAVAPLALAATGVAATGVAARMGSPGEASQPMLSVPLATAVPSPSRLLSSSDVAQSSTAQPGLPQPSTAQPSPPQPNTSQPNTSQPNTSQPNTSQPSATPRPELLHSRSRQRIEPLSAGRYRVQFTADASLKRKLEQARDLLRHAQPSGDFGAIVSRALDSLLDELLESRFGASRKRRAVKRASPAVTPTVARAAETTSSVASVSAATTALRSSGPADVTPASVATASTSVAPTSAAPTSARATASPAAIATSAPATAALPSVAATSAASTPAVATVARPAAAQTRSALPSGGRRAPSPAARRAVLERDGLGCSWVDGTGRRCGCSAWLELDHRHPAGKGGSAEPENLRLLCRAHNQLAAERAYGRAHIATAICARRQVTDAPPG